MMKRFNWIVPMLALLLLASCKQEVSIETLLTDMIDREQLAQFPSPQYRCAQFSSYDRATVAPGDPSWFANWDRSMFLRIEEQDGRKEYVMMDTIGPGAIVRFWMTFAGEDSGKGILRIYIDNDSIPAIEGGAMEILSGGKLVGAPLATSVSDSTKYEMRGHNLFLPIPYSKHCKVTYQSDNIKDPGAKTGGEAVYYNINYRSYQPEVKVVSFSQKELDKAQETLKKVQKKLLEFDREIPKKSDMTAVFGFLAAGQELKAELKGANAIRKLTFQLSAKNLEQALRDVIINITYDDGEAPASVQCPLGDFFGTGYQIRPLDTWYTKVTADGTLSAWWVMPFQKNCRVSLKNVGNQNVTILNGEIQFSPWEWNDRSMYFGSYWHDFHQLQTGEMKNNEGAGDPFDINYVKLNGKGVFVGDAITLFNTVYAWWGEGDEKIYVDRDVFPSHIGTGTEDYYGYAWCRPEKIINHPFIAQPDGSGNFDPGYTVNSRYRSLDAIPFNERFVFDMEMWHWTRATINFAPVSFYYLKEGTDPNASYKVDKVEKVAIKRTDIISPVLDFVLIPEKHGSVQAESMILKEKTGGRFRYQNSIKYGWADNMQVLWSDGKVGDKLKLSFISPTNDKLSAKVVFTTAPDYGTYRFKLNNQTITVNLTSKEITLKTVDLGKVQLNKGENSIEIEILETAPNEKKTTVFGFDEIQFN